MCWKQLMMQATLVELVEMSTCRFNQSILVHSTPFIDQKVSSWGTTHTHMRTAWLFVFAIWFNQKLRSSWHNLNERDSHHAQASHFLTCILMQHCHMSCWAGNQHEDKHKQHWKSYMQGNGQFESGSCCLCTNSQHAHVMQTCRSSVLTHKALAGL